MWYRKHLRQLRRARRQAKSQQRALLRLELEGFVALTLHTIDGQLTVAIERELGAQVADTLREALRDRRRFLKTEARQLRRDGGEHAYRQGTPPAPLPRHSAAPPGQPTAAPPLSSPAPPPGEPAPAA